MRDELVEAVARVLCERDIRNKRRHDTNTQELEARLPHMIDMHWRAYVPDARAALAVAEPAIRADERAWQPIETAPRDGTPILAYGPLPGCNAGEHGWHGVRETKWKCYPEGSPGYAAYERGEGPLGIGWDWYESVHNWSHSWQPTHWQPLPEPPAIRAGQGGRG